MGVAYQHCTLLGNQSGWLDVESDILLRVDGVRLIGKREARLLVGGGGGFGLVP